MNFPKSQQCEQHHPSTTASWTPRADRSALKSALGGPEVVVEVTYLTWTEGGLLRAVSYEGQREDKPAMEVVRSIPHAGQSR
jgi:hypothetical protein